MGRLYVEYGSRFLWEDRKNIKMSSATHARRMTVRLAKEEEMLGGISSRAVPWAAVKATRRPKDEGKLIVVIRPDTPEPYSSEGVCHQTRGIPQMDGVGAPDLAAKSSLAELAEGTLTRGQW